MSSRKLTPAKKVIAQKQFNDHMREVARIGNEGIFKDWPIPEPRTIGQDFESSTGGKRMPLEVPPQPVEWRQEGGVMAGTPPLDRYYQFLRDEYAATARNANGMVALVEGLRALAANPEIVAGGESGAFISGLLEAVEGRYPGQLLALLPSVGGEYAANARWESTQDLKARIIAEMIKHQSPKNWKNRAARKVAPLAFKWNKEALNPKTDRPWYGWTHEGAACETIRRWLDK